MVKKIELNPIGAVLDQTREHFKEAPMGGEVVALECCYGRTLFKDLVSTEPIPAFPKSTVDGYAVKTSDVPRVLKCVGKVDMGSGVNIILNEGECVYVPTGGMLPVGTDVMVMIEDTTPQPDGTIAFHKPAHGREHIIEVGSDMKVGQKVLQRGTVIGVHEMGALASLGQYRVEVFKKPKVTIIATGDELVDAKDQLEMGQIREINTYTLRALCEAHGLEVINRWVFKDRYDLIRNALKQAVETSDLVVISGGSSVGEKDYTQEIMDEVCDRGVLVAGMAIKPGKPTLIASHGNVPVIGLPGHPVSTIVVFKLIVGEILKSWGINIPAPKGVDVTLTKKVYAAKGRDTYQMVRIEPQGNGFIAHPTSGKSGMITLLSQSNGYVIIPSDLGFYEEGAMVRGYYF